MTTPDAHTVISVRGESQRIVAPDQASIYVTVRATADTKRAASSDVARCVAEVTAELAELGGEVLTALTTQAPLTWSTQSIQTIEEHSYDQSSGAKGPTGCHQASASLVINVRDFQLLGPVEGVVTGHDSVNVDWVRWSVDEDNPAWPHVRADAIRAALHKGQDYATALGGSIIGVEHIADTGLLGGDRRDRMAGAAVPLAFAGEPASASLDPVPPGPCGRGCSLLPLVRRGARRNRDTAAGGRLRRRQLRRGRGRRPDRRGPTDDRRKAADDSGQVGRAQLA